MEYFVDHRFLLRSPRELGVGFREYVYAARWNDFLVEKGHKVDREVAVMVYLRGEPLAVAVATPFRSTRSLPVARACCLRDGHLIVDF